MLRLFALFPVAPWWVLLCLGVIYSVSVSWNINGISHNFIHNPYFSWRPLNRMFAVLESMTLGFSQTFYKYVHHRHHMGNSDRPDEEGDTVDWLSIYHHGHDGEAENVWSYIFLSYLRDDPKAIFKEIKRKSRPDAYWGVFEIAAFIGFFVLMGILNWKFILFFLPFYYLGRLPLLSERVFPAFWRESGQTDCLGCEAPTKRSTMRSGSTTGIMRNIISAPNCIGPKCNSCMSRLPNSNQREGTRVIKPPHALAFLDPSLPSKSRPLPAQEVQRSSSQEPGARSAGSRKAHGARMPGNLPGQSKQMPKSRSLLRA